MNTTEFKSWFNGFAEAIGKNDLPTPLQWKRIQDEVNKLTPEVKTVTVSPREPFTPSYPKPYFPTETTPRWPEWKQPEIICKAGDSTFKLDGPAVAYSYEASSLPLMNETASRG